MSDTTQLIEGTVDKMLERLDALTGKLGIAASELWGYTVKAMIVNAKRDMVQAIALLFIPAILVGWAVHVKNMTLPHEMQHIRGLSQVPGGQSLRETEEVRDNGLAAEGYFYAATAFGCVLVSLVWVGAAVSDVIHAQARQHTAEYDAYRNLISTLTPKEEDSTKST